MGHSIKIPISAQNSIKRLGRDINKARRIRRISMLMMAERAGIAVNTLAKIERGEGNVSMGAWASVLFVLGLENNLSEVCAHEKDNLAMIFEEEHLPQRIYQKRKN